MISRFLSGDAWRPEPRSVGIVGYLSAVSLTKRPGAIAVSVLCLVALCVPAVARADGPLCPVPPGAAPALGEASVARRLEFLQRHLDDDGRRANTWGLGWLYGYTGLALVGTTLAGVQGTVGSAGEAVDNLIAAGASLVGTGFVLVTWLPVGADARALDALLATHQEPCAVLARAEQMLLRDADAEATGQRWYVHALALGFSIGISAVLGFGLGHWRNAVIGMVGGVALSEVQIATQPTGAQDARQRYIAGALGGDTRSALWTLSPMAGPSMGGVVLHGVL